MKSPLVSFPIALGILLSVRLSLGAVATEAPTLTPRFHDALRSGETRAIRAALDHGNSPNARDAQGNTPLILAALYGDVSSLHLLLDRGADVKATNNVGATALHRASVDAAKVALLVRRGADVNARTANGNTPLILAARPAASHDAVKTLLAHGADANATNHFGASPLMAAVAGGDEQTVKLLLKANANPNARARPDEPGFVFGGGRSPLMWAAFRGDTRILQLLLDAGAEVNAPDGLGTPLAQAAWADRTDAARLLLDRGARTDIPGFRDEYTPVHWAASSESGDDKLMKLLLRHGADPNRGGGESVDAFLGTPQTPLMLARRRGDTPIVRALEAAGATNASPDRVAERKGARQSLPEPLRSPDFLNAINEAVPPLQITSLESKKSFVNHPSAQNCTSCHQQHLPMAAIGLARKSGAKVDSRAERDLIALVREGEIQDHEVDWQPLFHPDPVMTKGYELLAYASQDLPADESSDSWVHHLAAIQGPDGRWYNNLPRPPIQSGDIGATALAIHALQRYPLPGRKAEFARRVDRARDWLRAAKPTDMDGQIYQLLGLYWAGESESRIASLTRSLLEAQRDDGGWAQLPGLKSDAYATGQAIYALRVGAGLARSHQAIDRGLRFLLQTQLADGTWHVKRRAFPFQPTMDSGFPHGRDSWISAAGTSWAVMALSLPDNGDKNPEGFRSASNR
jgi:ankyrin repeat protein